jgi:SAM-dependent methyltransferase
MLLPRACSWRLSAPRVSPLAAMGLADPAGCPRGGCGGPAKSCLFRRSQQQHLLPGQRARVMSPPSPPDASAGYEAVADTFRVARERAGVGAGLLTHWARSLPQGAAVLDLGCGTGVPVTAALAHAGCQVWGIDAAPSLVRVFQERFPQFLVACEDLGTSSFFGRRFDAVVAVGVLFLLPSDMQRQLIRQVADALSPDGRFLFTAPPIPVVWDDVLTGRRSESLGASAYHAALASADLSIVAEMKDEGANHYFVARPHGDRRVVG